MLICRVGKGAERRAHAAVRTLRFAHPTIIIFLIALVFASPAHAQRRATDAPVKIDVAARTIDAFKAGQGDQMRFGALEFRGGLELTSSHREFGGLSAIRVAADG